MITTLLSVFLVSQNPLAPVDPDLEYKTTKTEHFIIHYPTELNEVAARLAQIAEPVYGVLTKQLEHEPSGRTHVVLLNNTDSANGFSTPLPYNAVYLNIAPPDEGSSLDYYDDWLRTLFVHEFTHTIHIEMAYGVNKYLRYLFGRFWLPNAAQPQWTQEGLSIYNETIHTTKGRSRSAYLDMYLRTAIIKDAFLPIERATYWNHEYPFGNAAYWYGAGFHTYLAERFGEQSFTDFAKRNASWPFIGFLNVKTRDIFGTSFSRLWKEWQQDLKQKYTKEIGGYQSQYRGRALSGDYLLNGQGDYNAEKQEAYLPLRREGETFLAKVKKGQDNKFQIETLQANLNPKRVRYHNGKIYYAGSGKSAFNTYSEIFELDLESKKTTVTKNLRAKDPFPHESGVYAVQSEALRTRLIRIPYPTEEMPWDRGDLRVQVLYEAPGFSTLSSPIVSKDGRSLIFSMFNEGSTRDLFELDLLTNQLMQLTDDDYLEYFPTFSEDENWILFSRDATLGKTSSRVFNIFAYHRSSGRIQQLTDTWTGAYWPTPAGDALFLGHFSPESFKAHHLPLQLASASQRESLALEPRKQAREFSMLEKLSSENARTVTTEYQIGNTLLPRYLAPLWFITEDDAAIGAFTGSNDPLGFHRWTLFGAYLTAPQKPIGSFSYTNFNFAPLRFELSASAGYTDYGRILIQNLPDPNSNDGFGLFLSNTEYFERNYVLEFSAGSPIFWDQQPTKFTWSSSLFFENRRPMNTLPPSLATQADVIREGFPENFQANPERGDQIGIKARLGYFDAESGAFYDYRREKGSIVSLEAEWTPKFVGSDFETLIVVLGATNYWEFLKDHFLASRLLAGYQFQDVLYQRAFQLGGSFGDSPFTQVSRRTYALRGFQTGEFRGEGLILANLEYRFPLLPRFSGFGTAPLWLRNIHAAVFTDIGQTYQEQDTASLLFPAPKGFALNRFNWSAGVEIRADLSTFYAPPFQYRLGYAYVLHRVTNPFSAIETTGFVLGDREDQIYFQIGQSF